MNNRKIRLKKCSFLTLTAFSLLATLTPLAAKEVTLREALEGRHLWNSLTLFDDFAHSSFMGGSSHSSGMNLYEENNEIIVEANLPGLRVDDIEVTYNRGSLWIKGKCEEKKDRNYYHRSSNSYAYAIDIPSSVDESLMPSAEYENGVMKIRFQKSEEARPKRIEIVEKK